MRPSLLVLGAGFVGRALVERTPGAVGTHRDARAGSLPFNLAEEASWEAIPAADAVVWTFPAEPLALVQRFADRVLAGVPLVVLGTTSSLQPVPFPAWADEATPLQPSARVQGEEALRARGGRIARLSGLWGGERDPAAWVRAGWIRAGRRYVNLAHVDDVVAAVQALLRAPAGTVVNVCDGEPRRWRDHVRAMVADGRLPPGTALHDGDEDGIRVSNARLRALLPAGYRFTRPGNVPPQGDAC